MPRTEGRDSSIRLHALRGFRPVATVYRRARGDAGQERDASIRLHSRLGIRLFPKER